MAIENDQELQRGMDTLRQAVQTGNGSLKDLDKAVKQSTTGLKAFGKELKDLPADLAKGLTTFGKQLANGDSGLKTFNTVIDTAANAASGLAKTIPFAGEALSAALRATADASKFLVEQLDQTAKSFNEMGAAGALTAKGMTGLREQFTRAGLSMQGFQKQVLANSEALAQFRGMTSDGAEDFSKIVGDLTQGTDMSLRRLGMNADQIAGTTAAFVKQQTALGRAQIMSNNQLRQGTAEYAKELDLISKITGQNREAIQQQQDAALSESRFRAVYEEMMAGNQEKSAKALMGFQTVISGLDKEAGQGIRDLSSGIVDSAAAQKLYNSTNGKAADIIDRLKNGVIDQAQAQIELKNAVGGNIDVMRDQARYNKDAGETFIGLAGAYKLQRAQFDINGNVMKEAANTQAEQTAGADDLTNSTIKAQQNLEKLASETSKLATNAMPAMSDAVKKSTKAMITMFKWAQDTIGDGGPSNVPDQTSGEGWGEFGGMNMGGSEIMAAAGTAIAPSARPAKMSQDDLKKSGLKIKEGDVQVEGAEVSGQLLDLAKQVQATVPGFAYFSGFNDQYHQDKKGGSNHTKGRAFDFVLNKAPTKEEGAKIVDMLKSMGASYAQDEYANLSPGGTGGHIHAEVSAAKGAILSGPTSGYQPNLTMHGTEAIVPINSSSAGTGLTSASQLGNMLGNDDTSGIMMSQLAKLDEMVSIMKNQLNTSTKILQLSS